MILCGQLVRERRHRQRREELAREEMLVEAGRKSQGGHIAIFGLEQVCAMDEGAEKVFPRVEIDAPHRVSG